MKKTKAPLNLLRSFISAGQNLSFKLAAEELCVTPPAISQQIKQLEELLGVQLFIRGHRELELTKAGATYLEKTENLIERLDNETNLFLDQYGQSTLSVTALPPIASSIIIPNLESFQNLLPNVSIRIDSNTNDISIHKGEADLGIRFGDGNWPELESEKLLDVYLQPVFPPAFANEYDFSDPESLRKVPLIHITARPNAWSWWFEKNNLPPATPTKEFYLANYPSAIEAAKSLGAALALIPIELDLIASETVIAPIEAIGPIEEGIYAVYTSKNKDNPTIKTFIRNLRLLLDSTYSNRDL